MQKCRRCQEEKSWEEFGKHPIFKSGRNTICKGCKSTEARKFYLEHREEILARQYARRSRQRMREQELKRNWGLSLEQYASLLESQEGVCAICGRSPAPGRSLAVDHDHDDGGIRGLLCGRCNMGLGLLGDRLEHLRAATAYLEGYASGKRPAC